MKGTFISNFERTMMIKERYWQEGKENEKEREDLFHE